MIQKIMGSCREIRRKLLTDQSGNVLMFYGFAVIPIMFSVGMGVDYARAMKVQTKLNAAADAAALNSVSQTMMLQTTTNACRAAQALFESQSAGIPSVAIDSVTYTIRKTENGTPIGCTSITTANDAPPVDKRYVTVSYTARSTNLFGGILGWADLTISGSSGTYASVAPDIDFYLALDTSPSMGLPTTQQGMDDMAARGGCEFACHSNRIENNMPNVLSSLVLDNVAYGINKTTNIASTRSERVCGTYTSGYVTNVTQYDCTTAGTKPATGKFVAGDLASNFTNSGTNLTYTGPVTVIDSQGSYVFTNKTWTPSRWSNGSTNKKDNRTCRADGIDSLTLPSTPTKDICVRNASLETRKLTTSPYSTSNPATALAPSGTTVYVPPVSNVYADTYWLALNKGIRLRVTDARLAVADLMTLATTYRTENRAEYQAALYTFDNAQDGVRSLSTLTNNLSSISTASNNVQLAFVNDNMGGGCAFKTNPLNSNGCGSANYYYTSFTSILNRLASDIPTTKNSKPYPGNGTETSNPQGYIFLVTDGMSDEVKTNSFSNGVIGTMSNSGDTNRTRTALTTQQLAQCNYLKNTRGLKIAILYTEYTMASIESDRTRDPTQFALAQAAIGNGVATVGGTNIASRLTDCASPGLMYTVRTNESISNALQALFSKALASARIIN